MNNTAKIQSYAIQVKPLAEEEGGGYEALYSQLARGIVGYGATPQEAMDDLFAAVPPFLEVIEETGQALPAPEAPREWDDFSGKFNVRVPRMLHAQLVRLADSQDASLNALVQMILTSGATALAAGYEFGALVEAEANTDPTFDWQEQASGAQTLLRLEDYSALEKEWNPDVWKIATGN